MSKAYQRQQLPQNAKVQDASEQINESATKSDHAKHVQSYTGNGSGLATIAKTQPVTHRARLYRISSKASPEGTFSYIVVSDTLENPVESKNLPEGQPFWDVTDSSLEVVNARIRSYCQNLGEVSITDWRDFGSI